VAAESQTLLQLSGEVARATQVENSLQQNIDTEIARATFAETIERERAEESEMTIQQNIDFVRIEVNQLNTSIVNEISRSSFATATETSRAMRVEASLAANVSTMAAMWAANTTSLLATYSSLISSNAADASRFSTTIATLGANASSAQATLRTMITMSNNTLGEAIHAIAKDLANEMSRGEASRLANELTANATLSVMMTAATDNRLGIASLAERLQASNMTLFEKIEAARSQATVDAAALSSAHAAEVVRAMGVEGSIAMSASQQIQSEVSRAQHTESSLASATATSIDLVTSRATAGENMLQTRLDSFTSIAESNATLLGEQTQMQSAALSSISTFVSSQAIQAASRASSIEATAMTAYNSLSVVASTRDTSLRANISLTSGDLSSALTNQLSTLEQTRATDDSRAMQSAMQLSTSIKANTDSLASTLSTQVSALQAEKQQATRTETSLALASSAGISSLEERTSRTADALDQQSMQASTAANSLSMAIQAEMERAQSSAMHFDAVWSSAQDILSNKQATLTASLSAETSRAKSAAESLVSSLDQLNSSRIATALSLAAEVDAEVLRARAAEHMINASLASAGQAAQMQTSSAQVTLLAQVNATGSQAMALFRNETASLEARSSVATAMLAEDLRSTSKRHMQAESSLASQLEELNARVRSDAMMHSVAIETLKSEASAVNITLAERIAMTATGMSTALQAVEASSRLSEVQLSSSIVSTGIVLSSQVHTLGSSLGLQIDEKAASLAESLSSARLEASSRAADLSQQQSTARAAAEEVERSMGQAINMADALATSRADNLLSEQQTLENRLASDTASLDNRISLMSTAQVTNFQLQTETLDAATASIASSRVEVESSFTAAVDATREAASAASADLAARTSQQMSALTELHASAAEALNNGLATQQASLAVEISRATSQERSIQANLDGANNVWQTALSSLNASLGQADSKAVSAADQLQQNITLEMSRRIMTEASIAAVITNNTLSLNESLSRESSRAMQREASIQNALGVAMVQRSTAAFALNERASELNMTQSAFRVNISMAAEQTLQVQAELAASIAREADRANATEVSLATALGSEVVRAVEAESSEQSRATEAEASLAASLLVANASAWTLLDMERVRASFAEASIAQELSANEAARETSLLELQRTIIAVSNETDASVHQLAAALETEASTAARTETLLAEQIENINISALSLIGSVAQASLQGLQGLNATLATESARATQASMNVTQLIEDWSNTTNDQAVRLAAQLQSETLRAQGRENALANQLAASMTELNTNTNASLETLQAALAAAAELTALDTQKLSLALNISEAQARGWRREAEDLRVELDRFFGEQVDDARQGWSVALAGATECETCGTIRSNICLREGAITSAGLDVMENLAQTFTYRLYLLKTQPTLFTYGGNLSMIDANGIASMVVSQTAGNTSCLTVLVRVRAPPSPLSGSSGRRRNGGSQGAGNVTLIDLLQAINTTLQMPDEQLVWQQVQVESDGSVVMLASSTGKAAQDDGNMDTIAVVLIAWNIILSVLGLVLLVLVWRSRRSQRGATDSPRRDQTGGPLLKRYDTLEYGDALSDAPTLVSVGRRATNRVKTIFLPEPEASVPLPDESNTDYRDEGKARNMDMMFGVVSESSLSDEAGMSSFGKTAKAEPGLGLSKLERERQEEVEAQRATVDGHSAEAGTATATATAESLVQATMQQGASHAPRVPLVPSVAHSYSEEMAAGEPGHSERTDEAASGDDPQPVEKLSNKIFTDEDSDAQQGSGATVQEGLGDGGRIVADDRRGSVRTPSGVVYSLASSVIRPASVAIHSEDEYDQVRMVARVDGSLLGGEGDVSVNNTTATASAVLAEHVEDELIADDGTAKADNKPAIYTLPVNKSMRKAWGSSASPERVDLSSNPPSSAVVTTAAAPAAPAATAVDELEDANHYAEPAAIGLEETHLPGQTFDAQVDDDYPPMYTADHYSALLGEVDQSTFGVGSTFRETDMSI
jgi:hypothetical protein